MTGALIVGLVAAVGLGGFWWWWRSKAFERFFNAVKARLLDLGLVVHRLPDDVSRHLISEAINLYTVKKDFDPRRLAMRFFTWYAVERRAHLSQAFKGEAVLMPAMLTMRGWGDRYPELSTLAEQEISQITRYLHDLIEASAMPTEKKLQQQLELLHWAAGEPEVNWKAEMEKAVKAAETS